MIEVYDEIEADIYTVPGNSQFSGELAYYCSQRAKKYVFLAGSDFDLYPEYKTQPDKVDMYGIPFSLKTYAIENAQAHLLQNDRQVAMLKQGYGFTGTIIRNPIDIQPQYPRPSSPKSILWVGKSDERVKRPSLVFELARRLPHVPFVIIMNQGLPDIHKICLQAAQSIPNVTLIERVPFEEVERYYAATRLFVNTSAFEGFPNTFLQAAKYGVPVIATAVDPGGMLSEHGCGISCGNDFERFVESVQLLITDDDLYTRMSSAALRYVQNYHDKDIITAQYEKFFHEALRS
jgi:glycosyltransferase involved in cell wall biosynthesis